MIDPDGSRFDDAARAGWLYYIGGKTQDDIARTLNVSRPTAQRLVSLCRAEGLISFRMHHPIGACMEVASRLTDLFGLVHCDVVPTDGTSEASFTGVAEAAANYIERFLRNRKATVMALGTGRTMRAAVRRVPPMSCPHQRLVSLVSNTSPDGSASPFDALVKLAEVTQAQYFPMLLPMHASTPDERERLLKIAAVRRIFDMAERADIWLFGISQIDRNAVLYRDKFIARDELLDLIRIGGIGEITGWVFDARGQILNEGTNKRVTSIRPEVGQNRPRICVATGSDKVPPLRAALAGRIINGLVTDENTAKAILEK